MSAVRELCLQLQEQRLSHKISEEEFNKELTYVLLSDECFNELYPIDDPVMPNVVSKLQYLSPKQKNEVDWNDKTIKGYYNELSRARNTNQTRMIWLEQALKDIPEGDIVAHTKINARLNLYRRRSNARF
jgi:hypothetical protein